MGAPPTVEEDTVKPSIRKQDGHWVVTRPAFGFGRVEVTTHGSWKAAKAALLGEAVASAGPLLERGHHTLRPLNDRGWPRHGTIRAEDT